MDIYNKEVKIIGKEFKLDLLKNPKSLIFLLCEKWPHKDLNLGGLSYCESSVLQSIHLIRESKEGSKFSVWEFVWK